MRDVINIILHVCAQYNYIIIIPYIVHGYQPIDG